MTTAIYTAQARVTGGRDRGRTPDGELDVQRRTPEALGGNGGGANPEQLFAIGYAGFLEAVMMLVVRRHADHVNGVALEPVSR